MGMRDQNMGDVAPGNARNQPVKMILKLGTRIDYCEIILAHNIGACTGKSERTGV